MVRHQPGLALAVADLLPPVRLHRRAVVVPDERRRGESDLPAPRLQPPAHVHIVSRAEVDRVEAADRQQRVALNAMLQPGTCSAMRSSSSTCVGPPGARAMHCAIGGSSGGHDVGSAGSDDVGGEERLNEKRQPVAIDASVGVGVGDDLAGRFGEPDIARGAQPWLGVSMTRTRGCRRPISPVASFEPSLTRMIS